MGPLVNVTTDTPFVGEDVALFHSLGAASTLVGTVACNPDSLAPLLLGYRDEVGAYYGTAAGSGSLSCSIASGTSGTSLAEGVLSLSVLPSLWPVWEDAILVYPTGIMMSSRLGRYVNATMQIMQLFDTSGSGSNASITSNLTAVVTAAQSLWSQDRLHGGDASFTLTLTGSTVLVLRASQRAFRPGTTVRLGSVSCYVGGVSDDGQWLAFLTPPASTLCVADGPDAADCGYVSLSVNTSAPCTGGQSCESNSVKGAILQCPPFCPGSVRGGSAAPFPLSDGSYTLAAFPAIARSGVPPSPLASSSSGSVASFSSSGIYYALACASSGGLMQ